MTRGEGIVRGRRWMIRTSLWTTLLLVFAGCSDKNGVPSGILPRDKMESVMWDLAQADQYATLYLAKDSAHIDRKMETLRLYEEVFSLHDVTREQVQKSYKYYLEHPALNQVLFDSVIAHGARVRAESYDRPGPYRPPVVPPVRTAVVKGAAPGMPVGNSRMPGVLPGGVPGALPGGVMGGEALRARNAFIRARDSAARAHHSPAKADTLRHRP